MLSRGFHFSRKHLLVLFISYSMTLGACVQSVATPTLVASSTLVSTPIITVVPSRTESILIDSSDIPLENCNGSGTVTLETTRSRTTTTSFDVKLSGSFSAEALTVAKLQIGLEVSASEGEQRTFEQKIKVDVLPRSQVTYRIEWYEIWQVGQVVIDKQPSQYRVRTGLRPVLSSGVQQLCPILGAPTPTHTPSPPTKTEPGPTPTPLGDIIRGQTQTALASMRAPTPAILQHIVQTQIARPLSSQVPSPIFAIERSPDTIAICTSSTTDLSNLEIGIGRNESYSFGKLFPNVTVAPLVQCFCIQGTASLFPAPSVCTLRNTKQLSNIGDWRNAVVTLRLSGGLIGTCQPQADLREPYICSLN